MAIINGSLTIKGVSSLVSSSKCTFIGKGIISGKSVVTISGINKRQISLSMTGTSQLVYGTLILQRLCSAAMSGVSSLFADLVKVGKEFFRKFVIEGEINFVTTLEGGGNEYMKTGQDIQLVSGDYHEIQVKIYDEAGNPKDISGSTFHWVMNNMSKTNGNGIQITDPLNGEIIIIISPEDTMNLVGRFLHQAKMTDAQNHPTTIFSGVAKIENGIA